MSRFALKQIDEIVGRFKIFKLLVNNRCEYDEFERQIETEGSYSSELVTIQTRLQEIADGKLLPKEKFRNITPKKELVKEYEIKTGICVFTYSTKKIPEKWLFAEGKRQHNKKISIIFAG